MLECIWIVPKNKTIPLEIKDLDIKKSFFNSQDVKVFKGEYYNNWLESISGYTLFKEKIDEKEVKEINRFFKDYFKKNNVSKYKGEIIELSIKQINDFIKMFDIFASIDAKIVGWW